MHTEARNAKIRLIVVHVNVGPEVQNGAVSLNNYLKTIQAGYHRISDNMQTVVAAADNLVVWGAAGANHDGLHICLIGQATQTDVQWADSYSDAEIKQAAAQVAGWCRTYAIPVRRLSPAQIRAGSIGICGHVDVTSSYPGNAGHYDPGPYFPWTKFLNLVAAGAPAPAPSPSPSPVGAALMTVLPVQFPTPKAGPQAKAGNRLAYFTHDDTSIVCWNGARISGDAVQGGSDADQAAGKYPSKMKVPVRGKIAGLMYASRSDGTTDYSSVVAVSDTDGGTFIFKSV